MTEVEAEKFLIDEAFVAMPAARKFLLLNSSDPLATAKMQAKALLGVELAEGREVLDRWLSARLEIPSSDEMENLAIAIRRVALRERLKKASSEPQESMELVRSTRRPGFNSSVYYERMKGLVVGRRNGELSDEEVASRKSDLLGELDRLQEEASHQS